MVEKIQEEKEIEEAKTEEVEEVLVVPELPQVPTRTVTDETGKSFTLITIPEALKKLMDDVEKIKKGTVGV